MRPSILQACAAIYDKVQLGQPLVMHFFDQNDEHSRVGPRTGGNH